MSAQPEALRLVNNRHNAHMLTWQANACTELRRLHAANQELLGALIEAENALADYVPSLEKHGASLNYGHAVIRQARAAIAKTLEGAT